MKRVIKAATDGDIALRHAKTILNAARTLLNAMEDTPSGFLDANDLGPLYEELLEVMPDLDFAIKTDSLEYTTGPDGRITR